MEARQRQEPASPARSAECLSSLGDVLKQTLRAVPFSGWIQKKIRLTLHETARVEPAWDRTEVPDNWQHALHDTVILSHLWSHEEARGPTLILQPITRMGRTIHYSLFGNEPVPNGACWRIDCARRMLNQRFDWTCEPLALELFGEPELTFSGALGVIHLAAPCGSTAPQRTTKEAALS